MTDSPRELLADAAARWGTPLYVTDLDLAVGRLTAWQAAFPGALIAYAVKANADPRLLSRLVAAGAGGEVVSAVELALARRAGCPPERIVMNGVGRTDAELEAALAAGVLVNAESLADLDGLTEWTAARGGRARIGLRLNPGLDAATHPHLATGAAGSKFGIGLDELPVALGRLAAARQALSAIGAHIGSDIGSVEPFARLVEVLADAVGKADEAGLEPERIDLGGGLRSADPVLLGSLRERVGRRFPDMHRLILEPGRSVVADAGWLVTRVLRVQRRRDVIWLVVDAGMTELIRPILYGADHPVSLVTPGLRLEAASPIHLAGPVCEAGDILVRDLAANLGERELAAAGPGALLAIGDAGAYGAAMASNYNGRLRPAEAVIEGGELRLSRRRETLEDLLVRDT